jgi:hypothetical protein
VGKRKEEGGRGMRKGRGVRGGEGGGSCRNSELNINEVPAWSALNIQHCSLYASHFLFQLSQPNSINKAISPRFLS